MWWCATGFQGTREEKAGRLLEFMNSRPDWAVWKDLMSNKWQQNPTHLKILQKREKAKAKTNKRVLTGCGETP